MQSYNYNSLSDAHNFPSTATFCAAQTYAVSTDTLSMSGYPLDSRPGCARHTRTDTHRVSPCQHQGHRLFQSPAPRLCLSSIHQSPNRHTLSSTKRGKVSSRMWLYVCGCVCVSCLLQSVLGPPLQIPDLYISCAKALHPNLHPTLVGSGTSGQAV